MSSTNGNTSTTDRDAAVDAYAAMLKRSKVPTRQILKWIQKLALGKNLISPVTDPEILNNYPDEDPADHADDESDETHLTADPVPINPTQATVVKPKSKSKSKSKSDEQWTVVGKPKGLRDYGFREMSEEEKRAECAKVCEPLHNWKSRKTSVTCMLTHKPSDVDLCDVNDCPYEDDEDSDIVWHHGIFDVDSGLLPDGCDKFGNFMEIATFTNQSGERYRCFVPVNWVFEWFDGSTAFFRTKEGDRYLWKLDIKSGTWTVDNTVPTKYMATGPVDPTYIIKAVMHQPYLNVPYIRAALGMSC